MRIEVIQRSGAESTIEATDGQSLMEAIRDSGIEGIFALCGGVCACGTCHVYIMSMSDSLPPMSQEESDVLSCSAARTSISRLSCQIPLEPGLGELRVQIAPED